MIMDVDIIHVTKILYAKDKGVNMENEEKKLYIVAMIGALICFVGDNLLGYYTPAPDFGNRLLCINFSYDWANVNPLTFVVAGLCGIVALLMMFAGLYGVYLRISQKGSKLSKLFLIGAFVFVAVGTMYHNVFAIAAFIYNKLVNAGYSGAKELTLEMFNTFIVVGALSAVGYAIVSIVMFMEAIKGNLYPRKWMCIINPFVFMVICIVLAKVLPQTAFVNGVFDLGQQSMGFFIVFCVLLLTCEKKHLSSN